jgi:hypothetical protein
VNATERSLGDLLFVFHFGRLGLRVGFALDVAMPRKSLHAQAEELITVGLCLDIRRANEELMDLDANATSDSDAETTSDGSDASTSDDGESDERWDQAMSDRVRMLARWEAISSIVAATRNFNPRRMIPKSTNLISLILNEYRLHFHDHFRTHLRIWPHTFDQLVEIIRPDPVFYNNSINEQDPVEVQLALLLYRMGAYGNGAGVKKIAMTFGRSVGWVHKTGNRALTAVLRSGLRKKHIAWPVGDAREKAKQDVDALTGCVALREGWLMMDGTLVPLYQKPARDGTTYFDRKKNYSLTVQVSGAGLGGNRPENKNRLSAPQIAAS